MTDSRRPTDSEMAVELQREIYRLESDRSRAIAQRDRIHANVDAGDDTGHFLIVALEDLKRLEQRIEQISHLLTKERNRGPML